MHQKTRATNETSIALVFVRFQSDITEIFQLNLPNRGHASLQLV